MKRLVVGLCAVWFSLTSCRSNNAKAPAAPAAQVVQSSAPTPATPPFLTGMRQITFEGVRAGEGYFSRDGKLLIFQSEREAGNPFYQMYLMNLESGATHRVSPGNGKTTCGWI